MSCLLIIGALFNACKKKNDFIGRDNFITSFTLKKGSTTFMAVLTDSSIIIKAPAGFSLDSATATVKLSEHASIYPNPSDIISWNEESQFVVNAYDGAKKTYRYTVQRKDISLDNDVVLATQGDIDAFASKNVTEITGSLFIGSMTGTDSITNLNGLYKLKKIGYSLIIYPTFSASEIIGLDNLASIGGDMKIEGVNSMIKVALPLLETARNISIKNPLTENIQFPKLTRISQTLSIFGPLNFFSMPALQQIGGTMTLYADESQGASLIPVIAFPALTTAGDISILQFKQMTQLDFPLLTTSGGIEMQNLIALYDLSCPKLQKTTGSINLPDGNKLALVSFPALTDAGGLNLQGNGINALEFPILKTVGDLALRAILVDGLKDFPMLTTVTGELYIGDLTRASGLNLPATLRNIKKLTIYTNKATPPSEIDIHGITLGELNLQTKGSIKIIGNDLFHGTLTFNPSGTASFPTLQGLSEVDSLSLGDYIPNLTDLQLTGIHKINKSFTLPQNSLQSFDLPDLEEVGGSMLLNQLSSLTTHTFTARKLKKVGGDLIIATGYDDQSITGLSFPALETIGGQLHLYAEYAPWNWNVQLANLDGFSALQHVRSIAIFGQKALTDYTGLQNAASTLEITAWNVQDNNYNPSYYDLQNGNWTKP